VVSYYETLLFSLDDTLKFLEENEIGYHMSKEETISELKNFGKIFQMV
jgi:hypothetical protein